MYLTFGGKTSDCSYATAHDKHGTHRDHDGYVPSGIGIGGGDYIEVTVDVETGKIQNWDPEVVKKWINKEDI